MKSITTIAILILFIPMLAIPFSPIRTYSYMSHRTAGALSTQSFFTPRQANRIVATKTAGSSSFHSAQAVRKTDRILVEKGIFSGGSTKKAVTPEYKVIPSIPALLEDYKRCPDKSCHLPRRFSTIAPVHAK